MMETCNYSKDHENPLGCGQADLPSVTVVTVVCNDVANIEKTLLSVINQNYPRLEYIVIDGGSTDGTADIIKKYESAIDCWVSEKDRGIYDAMNKGIDRASGEWINFMHANDTFYNSTTIYDAFKNSPKDVDFIYGGVIHRKENGEEYIGIQPPLEEIWRCMPFCHQSLFSKTRLLKRHKFSLKNKISSDYQSVFFHYMNGKTFFNCNKIIAIRSKDGGTSDSTIRRSLERWRFARKYLNYKIDIYYLFYIPAMLLVRYAPAKLSNFILQKRYSLKPAKKALSTPASTLIKKD